MVDDKNVDVVFISYLDDDDVTKNQYVIIVNKDDFGVTFSFPDNKKNTIFIPWARILKIKEKEKEK